MASGGFGAIVLIQPVMDRSDRAHAGRRGLQMRGDGFIAGEIRLQGEQRLHELQAVAHAMMHFFHQQRGIAELEFLAGYQRGQFFLVLVAFGDIAHGQHDALDQAPGVANRRDRDVPHQRASPARLGHGPSKRTASPCADCASA